MLPIRGEYTVTATFGQTGRFWRDGHKGIDLVSADRNIYSVTGGLVRVAAYDPGGWGNYISVGDGNGYIHLYCHLSSTAVREGQTVLAGQKLGVMGNTGNSSGVHLHYQVNDMSGKALDPAPFLGLDTEQKEDDGLYRDDDKIASWAREAVYACREKGYLVGDREGTFRPKAPLTREEAAVLIMRLEERK